jgi:hypothetical protein
MAKKYRGSSVKRQNLIEMYGVSEMLKKIEAAGGKVDEAIKSAVDKSLEIVGNDMQNFMMQHKETGETMSAYEQLHAESDGNIVKAEVGYDTRKGGLPAIFLDVGTPKQKPYFYRYYAVENNRAKVEAIQREALEDILKELTK